jgi:hypothetical protein
MIAPKIRVAAPTIITRRRASADSSKITCERTIR